MSEPHWRDGMIRTTDALMPPGYPHDHPAGYGDRIAWLSDVVEWADARPGDDAEPERILAWLHDAPQWGAVKAPGRGVWERVGDEWRCGMSLMDVDDLARLHSPGDGHRVRIADAGGVVLGLRWAVWATPPAPASGRGVYSDRALSGGWSGD